MQVVKLAPQMRPVACELDRLVATGLGPRLGQAGVGRLSIDLQDAIEADEMPCHALRTSAVFEAIGDHRWFRHRADHLPEPGARVGIVLSSAKTLSPSLTRSRM